MSDLARRLLRLVRGVRGCEEGQRCEAWSALVAAADEQVMLAFPDFCRLLPTAGVEAGEAEDELLWRLREAVRLHEVRRLERAVAATESDLARLHGGGDDWREPQRPLFNACHVFAQSPPSRMLLPRAHRRLPPRFVDAEEYRRALQSCLRRADENRPEAQAEERARERAWQGVHEARHELALLALRQTPVDEEAWFRRHDELMATRWGLLVSLAEARLLACALDTDSWF